MVRKKTKTKKNDGTDETIIHLHSRRIVGFHKVHRAFYLQLLVCNLETRLGLPKKGSKEVFPNLDDVE